MKALILALALLLGACSAAPQRGPEAVRIDPAFTEAQRLAAYDAVNEWNVAAGLTIAVVAWDDADAIPVLRDDSLPGWGHLGFTNAYPPWIAITGSADAYDFQTLAAHELGHLLGLGSRGPDKGADGHGHSADAADLMFATGAPGERRGVSDQDVARVLAVVDVVW